MMQKVITQIYKVLFRVSRVSMKRRISPTHEGSCVAVTLLLKGQKHCRRRNRASTASFASSFAPLLAFTQRRQRSRDGVLPSSFRCINRINFRANLQSSTTSITSIASNTNSLRIPTTKSSQFLTIPHLADQTSYLIYSTAPQHPLDYPHAGPSQTGENDYAKAYRRVKSSKPYLRPHFTRDYTNTVSQNEQHIHPCCPTRYLDLWSVWT